MRKCYADLQHATELGACGIAVLLVEGLTDLTVIEQSRKGKGFDYWLGRKGSSSPLFQDKSRLEVSGILDGDEGEIRSRLRAKGAQMLRGGVDLPGYVIVVEFSRPAMQQSRGFVGVRLGHQLHAHPGAGTSLRTATTYRRGPWARA
jgi:hypothetical protein